MGKVLALILFFANNNKQTIFIAISIFRFNSLNASLNFAVHNIMSTEPNNLQHKWGFPEGITLALSPVVAYFLAYQYEVGYFKFFGVPTELITVDTTTLLVVGSTIVGFLTILFQFGDMLLLLTPESLLKLPGKVWPFVMLFLGFLCMWLVFTIFLNWWKAIAVPAWATLMFLMQYLSTRYYRNKAIPDKMLTLLIIAIVGIVLFRAIGKWCAENQRSFVILTEQPGSFVIQKMGDYLLLGTYDENSRTTLKKGNATMQTGILFIVLS